jgi:hypothetical protein
VVEVLVRGLMGTERDIGVEYKEVPIDIKFVLEELDHTW